MLYISMHDSHRTTSAINACSVKVKVGGGGRGVNIPNPHKKYKDQTQGGVKTKRDIN